MFITKMLVRSKNVIKLSLILVVSDRLNNQIQGLIKGHWQPQKAFFELNVIFIEFLI